MVDVRRLIDDVNLQSIDVKRERDLQATSLQQELEQSRDESLTHQPQKSAQKEVFISYTLRDDNSENFVKQIEQVFQEKGIKIIRDKNAVGYKQKFQEFMQRLSRGECVILIISDGYLKSENCMYELVEIAKHGEFHERIFPIVLEDAKIYQAIERIKYVRYWEDKKKELDAAMKKVSGDNLHGFREELDLYNEIRNTFAELTNLLKDMNALTSDIHIQSNFDTLLKAIEDRLNK
ncbi:hypothetical protein AMR41_01945 [Hapalosiphon sp. MRB220]|nr:hypothetical protein AMR41_01945 [Hapalosiphon sp. MRB220]